MLNIIFAGEKNAGKSTLINAILGNRIFKCGKLESTSTVFKIRNSETVKIIVEYMSGTKNVIDLTDKCDASTREGRTLLRSTLKELTRLEESKQFRSIDVGLPIPFLMVIIITFKSM